MQDEGLFRWLGNALGDLLRSIIDAVSFIFGKIGAAVHEFLAGIAASMGIDPSFLNIVWIVLGVWMLFTAIRAFARGRIFSGVIWLFLVTVLFGILMSGPAQASHPLLRSKAALPAGTKVVPLARSTTPVQVVDAQPISLAPPAPVLPVTPSSVHVRQPAKVTHGH